MVRIEEELINEIRHLAKSYTPEWRFSEEEPDIGSALAIGFAHGFVGTEKRFGRIREKNRVAFANATGAQVLPAEGAEGYAAFSLSGSDVSGSLIPRGTDLYADDDEMGQIRCETTEDVFVVPAVCENIFQTVDERDEILLVSNSEKKAQEGFSVFIYGKDNLQSHSMLLSEDKVLGVFSHGRIMLAFLDSMGKPVPKEWLEWMSDAALCGWEYSTEDGYAPFTDVDVEDGRLVLKKTDSMPETAIQTEEEQEGVWLKLSLHDARNFFRFSFSEIRLFAGGEQIYPELIVGGGIECPPTRFLPFGERLDPYSDVYFGSDEVLMKGGANARLLFRVDFRKQPFGERGGTTHWEWIMRKEDFVTDVHTDVAIEEVLWEYYNGSGWTNLFPHGEHRRAFSLESTGGKMVELRFTCPKDMEPVLVSSREIRFIRARITRISNLYKPEGSYILPVVSEPLFEYEYTGKGLSPSHLVLRNNLAGSHMTAKQINGGEKLYPFVQTDTKGVGLYLQFSWPPVGNPVRILLEMAVEQIDTERNITWEYLTEEGWRDLRPVDETKGLTRTGLLTFGCYDDIFWTSLFGKEGYWIRAVSDKLVPQPVFVRRICMNATRIVCRSQMMEEEFSAWQMEGDMQIRLGVQNVAEVEVYVDEQGYLAKEEEARLRKEGLLLEEMDDLGFVRQSWVRWLPVEDFSESGPIDRHYQLLATEGIVQFGDGRHGRVPAAGQNRSVRVRYVSVDGSASNLAADSVDRMGRSIGFVNKVTNPLFLSGGSNAENTAEAIERHSAAFRHQNRALCIHDFRQLVKTYVRSAADVRILRGVDKNAKNAPGHVTLVVLPEMEYGQTLFPKIRKQIKEILQEKISPFLVTEGRLSVRMPEFVDVTVEAKILVDDYDKVSAAERGIWQRLREYLDSRRWEIGTLPEETGVKNALFEVPGVMGVNDLELRYFTGSEPGVRKELFANPFVLPVNGTHQIQMVVRLKDD